jgi:predicted pyridoxine 5'-phosphate oxidase superfamily flavin-nucleotide-binding protein
MPDEHRDFFELLPFVLVGSLDGAGNPWASLVWGLPGFVSSPDSRTLRVEAMTANGDPLRENVAKGVPVAVLGLELETRRRNRANGVVSAASGASFTMSVTQSFGNCRQYIQARETTFRRDPRAPASNAVRIEDARLSREARDVVAAADTFFIASRSRAPASDAPGEGVDVSHRGGRPGFVALDDRAGATVLTFPDYVGNFLFNTLGNVVVDPRVGLLFVDHATGGLLALSGKAEIVWDGAEVTAVEGAQRLVRVEVKGGYRMPDALPFAFGAPSFAPEL